jgi:hypothetical protein
MLNIERVTSNADNIIISNNALFLI